VKPYHRAFLLTVSHDSWRGATMRLLTTPRGSLSVLHGAARLGRRSRVGRHRQRHATQAERLSHLLRARPLGFIKKGIGCCVVLVLFLKQKQSESQRMQCLAHLSGQVSRLSPNGGGSPCR
jgi:hypothetical protein